MYYRSGTGKQCCLRAGRCSVFTRQAAALFCDKWWHGRHLEIMALSRKSDLPRKQYSAIQSDWENDGAFVFFEVGWPNKNNKMSSYMRSVPDQSKIVYQTRYVVIRTEMLQKLYGILLLLLKCKYRQTLHFTLHHSIIIFTKYISLILW